MQIVKCRAFKRAEMEAVPGFVYCGRAIWGFARSPLCNPFLEDRPGKPRQGTRKEVIEKFRVHLLASIEVGDREILHALDALTADSVLGCWCKPLFCHCDVIAEVWESRQADGVALHSVR
jgi:hypothetical protein